MMVEAAYAGKIGTKIEALRTYNPARFVNSPVTGAPPSDQNINERVDLRTGHPGPQGYLLGNDFRSWYHSFQAQVTKRFSKGLSVIGSYTLVQIHRHQFHRQSRRDRGESVQPSRRTGPVELGPPPRGGGFLAVAHRRCGLAAGH